MKKWTAGKVLNLLVGLLAVIFLTITVVWKSFDINMTGWFLSIVLIIVGLSLWVQGSVKNLRDLTKVVNKKNLKMKNFVHTTSSFIGGLLVLLGLVTMPIAMLSGVALAVSKLALPVMWLGLGWYVLEVFVN